MEEGFTIAKVPDWMEIKPRDDAVSDQGTRQGWAR